MARRTRSGAQFSPYELSALDLRPRHVDIIRLDDVEVDSMLQGAMREADLHAARLDDARAQHPADSEWEDEPHILSRSPSPLTSLPDSPTSSCSGSPAPPRSRHFPPSHDIPLLGGIEKQRRKGRAIVRRKELRQSRAKTPYALPRKLTSQQHRQQSPLTLDFEMEVEPPSTGPCWIGSQPRGKRRGRLFTLSELTDEGCRLIKWNGRDPKLIVDKRGRIVAVLLGRPEDPDWDEVVKDAAKAMHRARREARRAGMWAPSPHRRGNYFPLTTGVSFGGGQKRPGNLANTRFFRRLINRLLKNKSIRRLAGFQSSGLAMFAPKLYSYYRLILKALFERQPELVHNFSNSIFPAATFNCGPDAVTVEHVDGLNLVHGFCGLTSGGAFDHILGGHVHMRRWRLVIECPSGSSLLIPSGYVDHGNTRIQPGEVRHSMTQYAAGGLFRWVTYGHQSAKALLLQKGGHEKRDAFDGNPGSRWAWAMDLFSKVDELDSDRAAVFGRENQ